MDESSRSSSKLEEEGEGARCNLGGGRENDEKLHSQSGDSGESEVSAASNAFSDPEDSQSPANAVPDAVLTRHCRFCCSPFRYDVPSGRIRSCGVWT